MQSFIFGLSGFSSTEHAELFFSPITTSLETEMKAARVYFVAFQSARAAVFDVGDPGKKRATIWLSNIC